LLCSLCGDQRDSEAVIAFDAYRLDGRHAHSRLRGGQLIEVADALDMRVATILVDQRAFAYRFLILARGQSILDAGSLHLADLFGDGDGALGHTEMKPLDHAPLDDDHALLGVLGLSESVDDLA
jgi:hypothetical protein